MKANFLGRLANAAFSQRRACRVPFNGAIRASSNFFSTTSQGNDVPSKCDVCVVGGAGMGSSVAFWLKQHPKGKDLNVVVLERDHTYSTASTPYAHGGARYQFSVPDNVKLTMYGMEFVKNIQKYLNIEGESPVSINWRERNYLVLASTPEEAQILEDNHKMQISLGAQVELLSGPKLKERFPWMNVEDVSLGSIGIKGDGWFDPWLLLTAYKKKAISLGAKYINADVVSFDKKESEGKPNDIGPKKVTVKCANGEVRDIEFDHCVLATGFNSGVVGKLAGIGTGKGLLSTPIPVEPRKRYTFIYDSPPLREFYEKIPILLDASGSYFRPAGTAPLFLSGKAPTEENEPPTENLDVDHSYFDLIWPDLVHRVPDLGNLKIKSAYGGYYDFNTLDQNAIIGTHPSYSNFHIITGFSGHGIHQSPGAGRGIMELILENGYKTLDLKNFGFERVIENRPLRENNIF